LDWNSGGKTVKRDENTLLHKIIKYRSCYFMILPFIILYGIFVLAPVLIAFLLSLTNFNMLEFPKIVWMDNFLRLFLEDDIFLISLKNTFVFAIITGPISYIACLIFAWLINELHPKLRAVLTFVFYAPSISGMLYVMWAFIFSGDTYGYLNYFLMRMNVIQEPVQWLTDPRTVLTVIIVVQIWMSLGASFLAFIAGLQNVDIQLYESGAVDGVRNRWQELLFITLPSMGPQLLFGAVIQISAAFSVSSIIMTLAGFPSTDYAALTVVTHIFDYGNIRFEMGYASAISVVLFIIVIVINNFIQRVINRHASD
jgi:multiple sugar transport system permease protein